MILGRQASKDSAGLSPVAEIWNQDSLRPVKISLQALYNLTITVGCAGIEFFEYHCTEPKGCISSEPTQRQGGIVSSPQCSDVNATLDETLSGFENQSVALVFGNRQIQRTLDGLGLGFRSQSFLGALDFHGIQLKVLVRSIPCRSHEGTPLLSI